MTDPEKKNWRTYTNEELRNHQAVKNMFPGETFESFTEFPRLMLQDQVRMWDEHEYEMKQRRFHAKNPPIRWKSANEEEADHKAHKTCRTILSYLLMAFLAVLGLSLVTYLLSFMPPIHDFTLDLSTRIVTLAIILGFLWGVGLYFFGKHNNEKLSPKPETSKDIQIEATSARKERYLVPVTFKILKRDNNAKTWKCITKELDEVVKKYFKGIDQPPEYPTLHYQIETLLMERLSFDFWDFEIPPGIKPLPPPLPGYRTKISGKKEFTASTRATGMNKTQVGGDLVIWSRRSKKSAHRKARRSRLQAPLPLRKNPTWQIDHDEGARIAGHAK